MKQGISLPQIPKNLQTDNKELYDYLFGLQQALLAKQTDDYSAVDKTSSDIATTQTSLTSTQSDLATLTSTVNTISSKINMPDYANGASKAYNTVHQAATNGWLSIVCDGSHKNGLEVLIGATSTPAQTVWRAGDDINSNTKWAGIMIPIPKDYYYKVAPYVTDRWETLTITFYPTL